MGLNIDQSIADLTKNEYLSLDQVEENLIQLDYLFRNTLNEQGRKDNRGIFVVAYLATTNSIVSELKKQQESGQGKFVDPQWVEAYLITFANLYRAALHAHTQNREMPQTWGFAFDKARNDRGIISLQHLMLSINAHVVHDLPVAVYQVGIGRTDAEREKRRQDHIIINETIRDTVNPIQDAVTHYHRSQGFSLLDKVLGPFDEWITRRFFEDQRTRAWQNAVYLTRLANNEPFEDAQTAWTIRTKASITNFDDLKRQIDQIGLEFANAMVVWGKLPLPRIPGFESLTPFDPIEPILDDEELNLLKEELARSEAQTAADWTEII
ncbi:MAG: hypothetical protein KDI79_06355 [Anaerolineae bacterium]|nr:hypothetical protein [Anaerolineae bacterium]